MSFIMFSIGYKYRQVLHLLFLANFPCPMFILLPNFPSPIYISYPMSNPKSTRNPTLYHFWDLKKLYYAKFPLVECYIVNSTRKNLHLSPPLYHHLKNCTIGIRTKQWRSCKWGTLCSCS